MSVLVKGMEMPKACRECPLETEYGTCGYYSLYVEAGHESDCEKRRDDCPLVPVPPHGDLIDRDALRQSIKESIEECHKWADEVDKDTMMYARISQSVGTFVECSLRAKAAPTIIPAENDSQSTTNKTVKIVPSQYQIVKQIDLTKDSIERIADAVVRKLKTEDGE